MIKLGGPLAYKFLCRLFPRQESTIRGRGVHLASYGERILRITGERNWELWKKSTIVDFGCGSGEGAIELAGAGAGRVIGTDIRPDLIESARTNATRAGVASQCEFALAPPTEAIDSIVSIDAFEHFAEPESVLRSMAKLLDKNGRVILSFGPTWYHPRGGHLFSVFRWAHLIISENALCRWRRDFRSDGALRFSEVEGGLNQMTIKRFRTIVDKSPFRFEYFDCTSIHAVRLVHNHLTREFLTSIVDCILVKKES